MRTDDREELIGVFEDPAQAEAAAQAARRLGVAGDDIRVQRREDHVSSLRAEMRDELERSWFSPQGGVLLTKRMVKGVLAVSPVALVLGVLVVLPLGFVEWGGLPLWGRLLLAAVVGALAGSVAGAIAGGGEAEKGAGAPLAAEHGITVRIADTRPAVQQAMVDSGPLRVDIVKPDGTPVRSVSSESETNDEGVVEDLTRAWKEPDRDLHSRHEDLSARRARRH